MLSRVVALGALGLGTAQPEDASIPTMRMSLDSHQDLTAASDVLANFEFGLSPEFWVAQALGVSDDSAAQLSLVQQFLSSGTYPTVRKPLNNLGNMVYTANTTIGDERRFSRLIVDTGSSDLWVAQEAFGSDTDKPEKNSEHALHYGQGDVYGSEVRDTVCLLKMCVPQQQVLVAKKIQNLGVKTGTGGIFDGLLGLGFPSLSVTGGVNEDFLQRVYNSRFWSDLAFGLLLGGSTGESFLDFGSLKDIMAAVPKGFGKGVTVPVLQVQDPRTGQAKAMYWLVQGGAWAGSSSRKMQINKMYAVIDSGTSLLAVPNENYQAILGHLLPPSARQTCGNQNGQVMCTCDTPLNSLGFEFPSSDGRQAFAMKLDANDLLQYVGDAKTKTGQRVKMCMLGIMTLETDRSQSMPFWILGDVFLRRVYAVHDLTKTEMVLFDRLNGSPAPWYALETSTNYAMGAVALVALAGLAVSGWALRQRRRSAEVADEEGADNTYLKM